MGYRGKPSFLMAKQASGTHCSSVAGKTQNPPPTTGSPPLPLVWKLGTIPFLPGEGQPRSGRPRESADSARSLVGLRGGSCHPRPADGVGVPCVGSVVHVSGPKPAARGRLSLAPLHGPGGSRVLRHVEVFVVGVWGSKGLSSLPRSWWLCLCSESRAHWLSRYSVAPLPALGTKAGSRLPTADGEREAPRSRSQWHSSQSCPCSRAFLFLSTHPLSLCVCSGLRAGSVQRGRLASRYMPANTSTFWPRLGDPLPSSTPSEDLRFVFTLVSSPLLCPLPKKGFLLRTDCAKKVFSLLFWSMLQGGGPVLTWLECLFMKGWPKWAYHLSSFVSLFAS